MTYLDDEGDGGGGGGDDEPRVTQDIYECPVTAGFLLGIEIADNGITLILSFIAKLWLLHPCTIELVKFL